LGNYFGEMAYSGVKFVKSGVEDFGKGVQEIGSFYSDLFFTR